MNTGGETVPVDINGAYPLAGWEIERALHGTTPILSPDSPLPIHGGTYVYNTRLPEETSAQKPGHWVAVYIPSGGRDADQPVEFFDSFGSPKKKKKLLLLG